MFAKWAPSELFSYFCPPPLNRPKVENKLCFQPEFSPLERKTGLKRSEIEPFCRWPANLLCGDRQNRAFDAVPPSFIPTTVRLLTQPKNPSAFKQKAYQVLLERFPIEYWPRFNFVTSTKHQQQNTDQTLASKNSPELQLQNPDQTLYSKSEQKFSYSQLQETVY